MPSAGMQEAQGHGPPETAVMREDWDNREATEQIKLSILELANFLNKFDLAARYRLARLNERISTLKSSVERLKHGLIVAQKENNPQ